MGHFIYYRLLFIVVYLDSFGIIIGKDVVCERVRIKVMNNQAKYFRSLPLHHSQKEVETTPEYSIFEYKLKPTYDFEPEILSHREDVEVLEPASLRETIKEEQAKNCCAVIRLRQISGSLLRSVAFSYACRNNLNRKTAESLE